MYSSYGCMIVLYIFVESQNTVIALIRMTARVRKDTQGHSVISWKTPATHSRPVSMATALTRGAEFTRAAALRGTLGSTVMSILMTAPWDLV